MKLFASIDRRIIYLFVFLALAIPLLQRWSVPPARMKPAEALFQIIEDAKIERPDIAFVAMDYGPNLIAENGAQAEVVIEHLMRKRIPFVVFSLYIQAEPFLKTVPERVAKRLMTEMPRERWEYGRDWLNLGYRPGGYLMLQGVPKSENLSDYFKTDARGNKLSEMPLFAGVKTIENIKLLVQFTGLVGMFDMYVAFFQKANYRPVFGHGCTSITIPEAFIYLDSKQLSGLLEGNAGAAWYSKLLNQKFTSRVPDRSEIINTGLGVAHLVVILLIILGNIGGYLTWRNR